MIKVAVCGAYGKMGREVCNAVGEDSSMELVAKVDIQGEAYKTIEEAEKSNDIDILIDFTQPSSIFENAKFCLNNGIKMVIGTTGLKDEEIPDLKKLSEDKKTGCFIAPNFSTGAVLMMMFSKMASKYFDNAEIIELHHNQKKDAPSGTAIKTALMMSEEKETFKKGNCKRTSADLRFGHDTALYHLMSLLGISTLSDERVDKMDEVVPMAANLQMIFYTNGKNVIVKLMLNEHEVKLFGLRQESPYFQWDALKKYVHKRMQNALSHGQIGAINTMVGTDFSVTGNSTYGKGNEEHGQ